MGSEIRTLCAAVTTQTQAGEIDPFGVLAETHKRTPTLLFVFVGLLLLRFAERQLWSLLFHEPPRSTRTEPGSAYPSTRRVGRAHQLRGPEPAVGAAQPTP